MEGMRDENLQADARWPVDRAHNRDGNGHTVDGARRPTGRYGCALARGVRPAPHSGRYGHARAGGLRTSVNLGRVRDDERRLGSDVTERHKGNDDKDEKQDGQEAQLGLCRARLRGAPAFFAQLSHPLA